MISKLVRDYEEHQEKKLFKISMAAMVVEANLQKALRADNLEERIKFIKNAIDDLHFINNDLTKNDFNGGN